VDKVTPEKTAARDKEHRNEHRRAVSENRKPPKAALGYKIHGAAYVQGDYRLGRVDGDQTEKPKYVLDTVFFKIGDDCLEFPDGDLFLLHIP
jgi:hypothetical protein